MLGLPSSLGRLDLKLAKRDLQRRFIADLDEIVHGDPQPPSEKEERSQRRVGELPLSVNALEDKDRQCVPAVNDHRSHPESNIQSMG